MKKVLLAVLLSGFLGCAAWNAGFNDEEIRTNALEQGKLYGNVAGQVSGNRWAESAVTGGIFAILVLIGGMKKKKKEPPQ